MRFYDIIRKRIKNIIEYYKNMILMILSQYVHHLNYLLKKNPISYVFVPHDIYQIILSQGLVASRAIPTNFLDLSIYNIPNDPSKSFSHIKLSYYPLIQPKPFSRRLQQPHTIL